NYYTTENPSKLEGKDVKHDNEGYYDGVSVQFRGESDDNDNKDDKDVEADENSIHQDKRYKPS
ncbi:unnamed protein product, partial [Prorocentrum cordatum]